jgi:hypothetical protein
MKLLPIACAVLFSSGAYAAPFIVSDPYPGAPGTDGNPSHCAIQYGTSPWGPDVPVGVDANGKAFCKLDASGAAVGSNTVKVKAVTPDSVWGRLESPPSAPFVFNRPVAPTAPSAPKLVP